MSVTSPTLRRRSSRWLPATITAAVLLTAGVLVAISAITRLVTGSWPAPWQSIIDAVTSSTWGSGPVLGACIALALIGLVMLLAATVPGAHSSSTLRSPGSDAAPGDEFVLTRKGLARLAAAAADSVDGVDRVSVTASGRTVSLRVLTSTREEATQVRERVSQVVTERLGAVGLEPAARVHVGVAVKEI